MNTTETKTQNHGLKPVARLILWPAAALSAWGNTELFGGSSALSMTIVLIAAVGLELGMMTLITLGARERSLRTPALAVGGCLLCLSLLGQYAFLLSRASGHEESVQAATTTEATAKADGEAMRRELSTVQTALDREQGSGWGPKAQGLAARADDLRARIAALDTTATTAAVTHSHRSPLIVLTERFDLDSDLTLKAASALFLLGVNIAGFLLLFASSMSGQPSAVVMTTPVNGTMPQRGAWQPAPQWLGESRQRIQAACAPSDLDVVLGKRSRVK